jgi:hypothetical protein
MESIVARLEDTQLDTAEIQQVLEKALEAQRVAATEAKARKRLADIQDTLLYGSDVFGRIQARWNTQEVQ